MVAVARDGARVGTVRQNQARGGVASEPRAFEPSDLEAVRRLIHATIEASYTGVYPPRAVQFFKDHHTADRILERYAQGSVVVVWREGELVGTGAIRVDHIMAVFVHPGHQRHGIGTAVMDALEGAACAAGHHRVHLDVSLPSRLFHESLGYAPMESRFIDVGDDERLDYWTAEKSLDASGSRVGRHPQ